ncbi:MAG: helix-turn-helix domain-containing protein [Salinigranum sp.]
MPYAKLDVTLPEGVWIRDISSEYPEATFRVIAALPGEDAGVGLMEITATDVEDVVDAIARRDGITSLDCLRIADGEALVQFETTDPALLVAVQESMVPLELPLTIVDGVAVLEFAASRERLSELGDRLRTFGMSFEVEYVRGTVDTEELLTDSQRDLLRTAVESGYYDTPRTSTLTELADALGIAKSTASERLHRAEERVIKRFVEDTDVFESERVRSER